MLLQKKNLLKSLLLTACTCLGLVESASAVEFIQFGEQIYPIEQLSSFAETGTETPLITNFITIKQPDNTLVEMKEGLNRTIDVDVEKIDKLTVRGLHSNERKWLTETFPGITDQQLRDLVRTVHDQGQDMTVINFIESFPLETLSTDSALEYSLSQPVVVEPVPPTQPKEESDNNLLKVLWYGQSDGYNNAISQLAADAHTFDPWGDGSLGWELDFWNVDDPTPDFSAYDVFVSGRAYNVQRLLESKDEISAARGKRTFLTGQDADKHYVYDRMTQNNGPRGFIIDAVNWAGYGQGLGIVSFVSGWWQKPGSFLQDELSGFVHGTKLDHVIIPTGMDIFPVNEGLTTSGISGWDYSAHAIFKPDIPGYISINDSGRHPGWAVTIVTESEVRGGTGGTHQIPEPSTLVGLIVLGTVGLLTRKR